MLRFSTCADSFFPLRSSGQQQLRVGRNQRIITQSVSESVSQWSEPFRPVASVPTPRAGNQKVKKVINLIAKGVKQVYVFG